MSRFIEAGSRCSKTGEREELANFEISFEKVSNFIKVEEKNVSTVQYHI